MSQDSGNYYQSYEQEDTYAQAGSYYAGTQGYEENPGESYQTEVAITNSRTKAFVKGSQKEFGGRKHSKSSKNGHRRDARRKIEEFDNIYNNGGRT